MLLVENKSIPNPILFIFLKIPIIMSSSVTFVTFEIQKRNAFSTAPEMCYTNRISSLYKEGTDDILRFICFYY